MKDLSLGSGLVATDAPGEIPEAARTRSHSINIEKRIETVTLPAAEKPTAVIIDREE